VLLGPLANVGLGILLAILCFLAIIKLLPKGGPWGRLILESSVGGAPAGIRPLNTAAGYKTPELSSLIGHTGVATTALFPSGQVNIDGNRYEARLEVGFADAGTTVKVMNQSEFGLIVEVMS
jgi:membrane-bound serine protease (ClpP class)